MSGKAWLWLIGGVLVFYALAGGGSSDSDLPQESEKQSEAVSERGPTVMPDVQGLTYAVAASRIYEIVPDVTLINVDLIGTRSIWDQSNWTVVDQSPRQGTAIDNGMQICVGVVKNDELSVPRRYQLPSSNCPKSQSQSDAEIALAWVPPGFEAFGDTAKEGFAFENDWSAPAGKETDQYGNVECEVEGVPGRCNWSRLASRDGCTNGAFVIVQWLNSLNEVVDVSIFSTKEPIKPRGVFEFYAFLPHSTWKHPVTTRLLEVRC